MAVAPVFREWLERTQPLASQKVKNLVRQTRGGKLNDSTWGQRLVGSGVVADQIRSLFRTVRAKLAFCDLPDLDATQLQPPAAKDGQLRLF